MKRRARVRVAASTSNLGAGFDCVGVALNRHLELTVNVLRSRGIVVERSGTLADLDVPARQDLLVLGFAAACRAAKRRMPTGLGFNASSSIPVARGLGSSAAALVAGAAAARSLLGLSLSNDALFRLASAIEGHPDNVAPIVYGGAVLVVHSGNGAARVAPLKVHRSLVLVFAVPDFEVTTARARAVLPGTVAFSTAVAAAARAAALVAGLERADAGLLASALDDVLHVPHRKRLVKGYAIVAQAARGAGAFGATLSGSGSTLMAIAPRARARAVGRAMVSAWGRLGVRAETFSGRPTRRRL
jgi:homoserine kinase